MGSVRVTHLLSGRARAPLFAVSLAAAALMYSTVAWFPYLRGDDTFLIRTNWFTLTYDAVHNTGPRFWHIIIAKLLDQGRVLFWLCVNGSAYLYDVYGLKSLTYVRGAGVGVLGIVGYAFARHLLAWNFAPVTAVCLMVLTLALPGLQIITGNRVWLVPGLALAMTAAHLMMRTTAAMSRGRRVGAYAAITALLVASLSGDQSLAFVFVAVTAAALASSEWEQRPAMITRYVVGSVALMGVATLVYVGLWVLGVKYVIAGVYSVDGDGYSPQMLFHELPSNLGLFWERRVPQVLNLWHAPYISRELAAWVAGAVLLVWAADAVVHRHRWRVSVLKVSLYATLFAMAESCMIVADKYNYFASKYTTSVAQSIVMIFVLVDTARRARGLMSRFVRADHGVYRAALLALTIACAVKAQTQTWALIVMPSSLETRFVGAHIAAFMKTHHRIDEIELIGRSAPLMSESMLSAAVHPEQFGEFTSGTMHSFGSMTFLARNVMLDMTGVEPTRVLARIGAEKNDFIYPGRTVKPDSGDYHVVIDTNQLEIFWRP